MVDEPQVSRRHRQGPRGGKRAESGSSRIVQSSERMHHGQPRPVLSTISAPRGVTRAPPKRHRRRANLAVEHVAVGVPLREVEKRPDGLALGRVLELQPEPAPAPRSNFT